MLDLKLMVIIVSEIFQYLKDIYRYTYRCDVMRDSAQQYIDFPSAALYIYANN